MIKRLIFLLMLLIYKPIDANEVNYSAPFGLTWGSTPHEIAANGVNLVRKRSTLSFFSDEFVTSALPKSLSTGSRYTLRFGRDIGLSQIMVETEQVYDDTPRYADVASHAEHGKSAYDKYKKLLGKKYTLTYSVEKDGRPTDQGQFDFYQCISEACGRRFSVFEDDFGRRIELELFGVNATHGALRITYFGPTKKRDDLEERLRNSDVDAL